MDIPEPQEWLQPGQLLLSTGYAWPRDGLGQRRFVRSLDERGLAALGLAVPQFFSSVPPDVVREADIVGLPVLEVPWEIPFARITEETQRALLAEQHRVIERSEAIHRALTRAAVEASSLQEIAKVLADLIDRDVTFESLGGQRFAVSSVGAGRTVTGVAPAASLLADLERHGHLPTLRTQSEPFRVPEIQELGLSARVACPVRLSGELVGVVWIVEGETPLGELDLRAAQHAATVVALHIAHQRSLAQLESRLGYAFLDSLLEGRFEATAQNRERARLLGFDWERNYRVGVAVMRDEPVPLSREGFLRRERLAERLRKVIADRGFTPFLSVSLNEVSMILAEGVDPQALGLAEVQPGIGVAFGRPHAGTQGVRASFREAHALLPHVSVGEVLLYDRWLVPRALLGDPDAREALLDDIVGSLRRTRGGDALVSTVIAWSRGGFEVKGTARELGVHVNTVRYRLERIAAALDVDLADPETRFRLRLATEFLYLGDKSDS